MNTGTITGTVNAVLSHVTKNGKEKIQLVLGIKKNWGGKDQDALAVLSSWGRLNETTKALATGSLVNVHSELGGYEYNGKYGTDATLISVVQLEQPQQPVTQVTEDDIPF